MAPVPYQGIPFPNKALTHQWGQHLVSELRRIFALPVQVDSYTVATLPGAADVGAAVLVFVSDEAGGATLAFSDGTSWRRVQDRAVVS